MAEETKTVQPAQATQPVGQQVQTEAQRRRQSARDRQNNRVEQARRPGSTVITPESPAVTFEIIYYIRRIDQAMASLSRNVFQNGTDFSKIEKAGKSVDLLKKELISTAKQLSELANITYTDYQPR